VDFGINARLTPADYVGVDMTPVRELKRAQEAERVRAKSDPDAGTIARGQQPLEQQAQALERASKKLESAGQTVHQVEDLLHDTLSGFRANRAEHRHPAANERLLKSADETAADIVGLARFDEEALFPPTTSPIKFEEKKAVNAYAQHAAAMRQQRGTTDPPEVAEVLGKTNVRLRGEGGVLPTLGELAETGARDPDATEGSLQGLSEDMSASRHELAAVRQGLAAPGATDGRIDVAS
jgi:hypothetical protein